ncbi:hypothetical protein BZM26_24340 [Paraburkholderia strydomiana]|nr:hypothetical protein BZM26_24340 [Paraburkholderia strydomiana]
MMTFVGVVETGSLTTTAVAMQLPIASVSRNIQAVEGHLGTTLFNRTTRAVRDTEERRIYYGRRLRLLADMTTRRRRLVRRGETRWEG